MDETKLDLNKRVEDALEVIRLAEKTAKSVAKSDYCFSGLTVAESCCSFERQTPPYRRDLRQCKRDPLRSGLQQGAR